MASTKSLYLTTAWIVFGILLLTSVHPISTAQFIDIAVMAALTASFYVAVWLFPTSPIPVVPNISILFVAAVSFGRFQTLLIILLTAPLILISMRHMWRVALFFPAEDAISAMAGYFAFVAAGGTVGQVSTPQWMPYVAFWTAFYSSNVVLIPLYYRLQSRTTLKRVYFDQILQPSAWTMNLIDLIFGAIMLFAFKALGLPGVLIVAAALWLVNVNYRSLLRHVMHAQRDELTGLPNRRHFNATVHRYIKTYRVVSLLLLDLDDFKLYNDSHGHVDGDRLLQQVAQLLSDNLGPSGVVCRYGGEEFAIALPATQLEAAFDRAEQIRMAISSQSFPGMDVMPHGCVTISIGLSTWPVLAADMEQLVLQADAALYKVKYQNKNQSLVYEPSELSGH